MAKTKSAINMTDRWLERLKPPAAGEDRAEYFDENVHGLGLRASATGHKSWFLMYRTKGDPKVRRLTLGTTLTMSLADARTEARAALVRAAAGDDPAGEKREDRDAPTFGAIAKQYLELHAEPRKKSWTQDRQRLDLDLLPRFGRLKAKDIRRRDVMAMADEIVGRGAPVSANRALQLMRRIYNWAISRDLVEINPCLQVALPAAEKARERWLESETELRAVWAAMGELPLGPAALFKVQLLTGQRVGEVRQMRWADVDLVDGWWTIPAEIAKNGRSHRVPLTALAVSLIEQLRQEGDDQTWIFRGAKSPQVSKERAHYYSERVRAVSAVTFVPHDLRRTCASWMAKLGVPRLVVSKVLNHAEAGVTWRYDRHSYDAEKRDALDRWTTCLLGILSS